MIIFYNASDALCGYGFIYIHIYICIYLLSVGKTQITKKFPVLSTACVKMVALSPSLSE